MINAQAAVMASNQQDHRSRPHFQAWIQIFKINGAQCAAEDGKEIPVIMGSYGIGIERILSSSIELYNDDTGMALPASIAPFDVIITPVNYSNELQRNTAEELYRQCLSAGLDALLDDRDERPGVKFKDADLIGIPYRITIGKKLANGIVELFERRGKATEEVPVDSVVASVREKVKSSPLDES